MDDFVTNKMKKKTRDRLSELPESLIFKIFWLLPMTDVVRTSVLSSRWKQVWTTSPYLNFNGCYVEDRLRDFINSFLKFWIGKRIVKLKIDLTGKSLCGDADFWVRLAKINRVKELYLRLDMDEAFEAESWVPQCLYSCSSLKELSLRFFNVRVNGNVSWNQLKRLTIEGRGSFISQRSIQQILSGSPQLEDLTMFVMEDNENLSMTIQSDSLRSLRINKYFHYLHHYPSPKTELRICTPKLEKLEISGAPYSKCLLMNASSLTCVNLWFDRNDCKNHHSICWNDVLRKTLAQILPSIQHVARVRLSDWCTKVIRDMMNEMILSLPDVKLLQFYWAVSEITEK